MRRSIYKTFQIICLTTLALYLMTLAAVPYVGVYLTYVAIPATVLSGLLESCICHRQSFGACP